MKKLDVDKLLNVSLFSLIILFVIYLGVTFWRLPSDSLITVPGSADSLSEEIGVEETSLHRVSVRQFAVYDRLDFLFYMWRNKTLIGEYGQTRFTSGKAVGEAMTGRLSDNIGVTEAKYDVIFDYLNERYGVEDSLSLFDNLTVPENVIGNSDSLAIALSLIGLHEEKPWLQSEKTIVISGALDGEGRVLPVGDIYYKGLAAIDAGADVLIVPAANFEEAKLIEEKKDAPELVSVETIEEAVAWLDGRAGE